MGRRKRAIAVERRHVLLFEGDFDLLKIINPRVTPSTVIAHLVKAYVTESLRKKNLRRPINLRINPNDLDIESGPDEESISAGESPVAG